MKKIVVILTLLFLVAACHKTHSKGNSYKGKVDPNKPIPCPGGGC